MQLFLDSYGAFLGLRDGQFWVKPRQGEGRAFAIREVNAIFLTKGVRLTTDALILAIRENIPVLLIDAIGHPIGQVWSGQFGSIATIRKNQALFSTDSQGLRWISRLLRQKIDNQQQLLQTFLRSGEHDAPFAAEVERSIPIFRKMSDNLRDWQPLSARRSDDDAASFRGWEGTATRHYFRCLSLALPEKYRFAARSKRPAYDPFNALLNYLYGMLYAFVELAQMKAGLDPYTGVLHADEYNRPTLVFDQIEIYRHWPERIAVQLLRDDRLPADAFRETEKEGVWLEKSGKGVVIDSFLAYLDEKIEYREQVRRRATHIDLDALRLASRLKSFEPSK